MLPLFACSRRSARRRAAALGCLALLAPGLAAAICNVIPVANERFRGAQDTFFGARDSANAEVDREFAANAVAKEALLAEAEALVPVTDLRAAKEASDFQSLQDQSSYASFSALSCI